MKIVSKQKGFAPIIVVLAIVLAGLGSVGTATAANNSKPGDPLFGLDTALEQIQVNLASSDVAKAEVRLKIARERLDELQELEIEGEDIDEAVIETQIAVDNAATDLTIVQTRVSEHKITLTSADLQALLTQLQNILSTHQGLVRRVEIRIKDGEIRAKVKLFEEEASGAAREVEDDLEDLEDDGELNDSKEDDDRDEKPVGIAKPSVNINDDSDDDDEEDEDDDNKSNSGSGSGSSGSGSSGSGKNDDDD